MKLDLNDIFKSWIKSFNPSERDKELAAKRWEICMGCDQRKEIIKKKEWSYICSECGCKLDKKIFTDKISACPLNKWDDVEKQYFTVKRKETLI